MWYSMKKISYIVLLLLLYAHPAQGQSEIYNRYAPHTDLDVGYFKHFRIDSTLAVDATVIIAKDSAAWEWMKKEFEIPELDERCQKALESGQIVKGRVLRDKKDFHLFNEDALFENLFLYTIYNKRCVVIIEFETEEQYKAIFNYTN